VSVFLVLLLVLQAAHSLGLFSRRQTTCYICTLPHTKLQSRATIEKLVF